VGGWAKVQGQSSSSRLLELGSIRGVARNAGIGLLVEGLIDDGRPCTVIRVFELTVTSSVPANSLRSASGAARPEWDSGRGVRTLDHASPRAGPIRLSREASGGVDPSSARSAWRWRAGQGLGERITADVGRRFLARRQRPGVVDLRCACCWGTGPSEGPAGSLFTRRPRAKNVFRTITVFVRSTALRNGFT
jgi:hypothetical protein